MSARAGGAADVALAFGLGDGAVFELGLTVVIDELPEAVAH